MPGTCGLVSQDSSLLEGGVSLDGSDTQSQTSTPRMRITPARKTGNFLVQPVRLAEVLYIGCVYRVKGTRGQGHMRCGGGGALFTCLGLVPVQYTVFYIPILMGFN